MAILKEISDSEAARLSGSKSSQERGSEGELAWDPLRARAPGSRASSSAGEEGGAYRRSREQADGQQNEADSSADFFDQQRKASRGRKPGAGEAVLLGALATGVNGPTWFLIKVVLVALAASLFLLLHVAIRSSNTMVLLNVIFLIIIAVGLALGLIWYVSQIGLVPVEKQMAELNLADGASEAGAKRTE
ncbi:hypothetical protein R1sor_001938 [Riccia sorocarpa]|uniref:Uncharacterized protein n=1 Tax=Riccia sorocarpa TaxID=122646 RepID=A0ABD3GZ04_9MARC